MKADGPQHGPVGGAARSLGGQSAGPFALGHVHSPAAGGGKLGCPGTVAAAGPLVPLSPRGRGARGEGVFVFARVVPLTPDPSPPRGEGRKNVWPRSPGVCRACSFPGPQ